MSNQRFFSDAIRQKLDNKLQKVFPDEGFEINKFGPDNELTIEWFGGPSALEVEAAIGKRWYGFKLGHLHCVYCEYCGYEAVAMPDRPICRPCSEREMPPERPDRDWF